MKTKFNPERSGQHSKFPLNTLYSVFFILILYSLFFIPYSNKAYAVTEFISTIKQSGGDYSTLSSWEAAIQLNLAASTTVVYSGTGTGSLSQGNIVELFRGGVYQNATSTVIATTSSQILVQNYYNSGAPITLQSGDEWRKASSTANMFTVSGSGVQLGDTAIAIAQIDGAWTSADTTAVTINGWTTDATHYIKIYTTAAARHTGKWDTGKYRLEGGIQWQPLLNIAENNVRIDGLQVYHSYLGSSGENNAVIFSGEATGPYYWEIKNSIVKLNENSTVPTRNGIFFDNISSNVTAIAVNNIVYDCLVGIRVKYGTSGTSIVYNNTVINCSERGIDIGRDAPAAGTVRLKNNIVQGTSSIGNYVIGSNFSTLDTATNLSQDATSPNTALRSKTVSFVDATNKDFHLSSSDTSAKDAGTNLSADPNLAFSDDIDGNTRPIGMAWDIGADETYGVIIIIE